MARFERSKRCLMFFVGLTACLGWMNVGCLSTRNVMFINPDRASTYLEQRFSANPPIGKDGKAPAPMTAEERTKFEKKLKEVPDSHQILGGFCTDAQVQATLEQLRTLRPKCRQKLGDHQDTANLHGRLFWGFLLSSIGTGSVMIVSGALAGAGGVDPAVGAGFSVAFGITTLVLALTNGFVGFDGRQERYKLQANRLDNFMWTIRVRLVVEVCNAKSVEIARQNMKNIHSLSRRYCTAEMDDGSYDP